MLRRLYAEDADWNKLIVILSEGAVAKKQDESDFEAGYSSSPDEVAMHSLLPRISTVVYRTHIDAWDPLASVDLFSEERFRDCAHRNQPGEFGLVVCDRGPKGCQVG